MVLNMRTVHLGAIEQMVEREKQTTWLTILYTSAIPNVLLYCCG